MSRKHAELEREFLDELALRTGRSLAAWMEAIDAAGITDRNAIIDWLRPQGLTFAHASWLERIHHNGGRPIYVGGPGPGAGPGPTATPALAHPLPPLPSPVPEQPSTVSPVAAAAPPVPRVQRIAPATPRPRAAPLPPPSAGAVSSAGPSAPRAPSASPAAPVSLPKVSFEAVAHLLARGKGLRMLAEHLLREIARTVPGSEVVASGDLVSLRTSSEFGVLAVSAKDLRLGLALPPHASAPVLQGIRIAGAGPHITRMAVLDDARQVDGQLLSLVHLAQRSIVPI